MTKTTETNRNNNRVILLFGLIFTTVGIFASINPIKLLFTGNRETGTVVNVEVNEEEDDDGGTYYTYTPIVKYKCGGNVITESARSSSSFKYKRGESINIICDPLNYGNFILYSDFLILLFPIIGLFVLFIYFRSIKGCVQSTSNITLFLCLFMFGGVSLFLLGNLLSGKFSDNILSDIFLTLCFLGATILIGYGAYKNLQNSNRIKNAKNDIEKGLLTQRSSIVNGFHRSATILDKSYYEIITTDGNFNFHSEQIPGKVIGFNENIANFLDAQHIIYNPKDPQKALNELHNISCSALGGKYQGVDKFLNNIISIKSPNSQNTNILGNYMQELYIETEQRLKDQIELGVNYEQPYGIFNGKKLSIGDDIKLYIDPLNEKNYLVDLSILN